MNALLRRLGAETRYTLLSLPLSVVAFCLVVTGLSLGAGTLVVVLGLFVPALTLLMARGMAGVDRALAAEALERPLPVVGYRPAPAGAGPWRRLLAPLFCGQSWLDALGTLLRFPVAVATFAVTVAWWSVALAGLAFPLYSWTLPDTPGNIGLAELAGLGSGDAVEMAVNAGLGAFAAVTLPAVMRVLAHFTAAFGRALVLPRPAAPARPDAWVGPQGAPAPVFTATR
ncbi:sensor domain-containing protein [Streptomonospora nanhaiensis]|uniref:sensor domain-containing protein n=1 Tax=Streptomonospora nanhaiensis TaxID=1323731 RepID=UPI001C381412|nr:sensor domain-containing protein [Streptomonospora nanhaiensis]MBV2363181.1 sensor domain-containing protein [Streptomonospora nanhaiensis]